MGPSLCTVHDVLQNFLAFLNTFSAFLSFFSKLLLVLDVGKNKASSGCPLPGGPRARSDERDTVECPGNSKPQCLPPVKSPSPFPASLLFPKPPSPQQLSWKAGPSEPEKQQGLAVFFHVSAAQISLWNC